MKLKGFLFGLMVLLLVFANLIGIGYALYLWGGTGLAIGASIWAGFKLWILMIVGSLLSGIALIAQP